MTLLKKFFDPEISIGAEQAVFLEAIMEHLNLKVSISAKTMIQRKQIETNNFIQLIEDNKLNYGSHDSSSAIQDLLAPYLGKDTDFIRESFTKRRALNCARNLKIKHQVIELNQALLNDGLNPVFLKGSIRLFDKLYPSIGDRRLEDIDVLLPLDQIKRATEVTLALGYHYKDENHSRYKLSDHHHLPVLERHSPSSPAVLEIHHALGSKRVNMHLSANEIAKEACKLYFNKKHYLLVPSDGHQLRHNILHSSAFLANGQRKFLPIASIIETLLLANRQDYSKPYEITNTDIFVRTYLSLVNTITPPTTPDFFIPKRKVEFLLQSAIIQIVSLRRNEAYSLASQIADQLLRLSFVIHMEGLKNICQKKNKTKRLERFFKSHTG